MADRPLHRKGWGARHRTSPANFCSHEQRDLEELSPPHTPEVQRQLHEGGPTTTMLDVALGIVQRLKEVDENDPEELEFLENCLKAGTSKTAVPYGLVEWSHSTSAVRDILLRMYNDTPSSQMSATNAHNTKRSSISSGLFFHPEEEEDQIVRWPMASLDTENVTALNQLMQEDFGTWGFDTFRLAKLTDGRPLKFAAWEALRRNNLFSTFAIDQDKAHRFLERAASKYASQDAVPYHNNLHAADATQSVHALLGDIGFANFLDNLSGLTLVLSAAIHDMGHDGRSNNFHINVQDDLALTYNDRSILENFHVSQAFRILTAEHDANILSSLDQCQYVEARKQIIEAVLGTDMAHHFLHVGNFKAVSQRLEDDPLSWVEDTEGANILRVMTLHAADTSTPAKPPEISDQWTENLRTEFFRQGDLEKELGLPVSPLCDRETVMFASSQVGFMQFIVKPTFELFVDMTPKMSGVILQEVEANLKVWLERKEKEAEAAAEAAVSPSTRWTSRPGVRSLSGPG
mmetsp:Transcript_74799/g.173273  ORF Transcript_74799/g.173273 Transcript_74799/m.173273 type:complete len:518 (+) Transcript_74799:112-1665(+)